MAIKGFSPWWLFGLLLVSLLFIFTGERAFSHTDGASAFTFVGLALLVGVVGLRGYVVATTEGNQRRVELISLLCHGGIVLALIGYYLTTASGMALFGIDTPEEIERWTVAIRALWLIVFFVSMIPLLLIEVSLGMDRGISKTENGKAVDASVDVFRVREMGNAGLTISLAMAFLMVTCKVADQHNLRKDMSYFKTSAPGSATVKMVNSLSEPLEVLLFFPESNDVELEVMGYFESLASETDKLRVSRHDRLMESALAEEHKVSRDGTIVLVRGDKTERMRVKTDIEKARRKDLRELDSSFQKALLGAMRDPLVACFSVGHGELNDPGSASAFSTPNPLRRSTALKSALKQLNYSVKDYEGFGKPVPDDCKVLYILAPRMPYMEEELVAVDEFLAQGGSAVITLDPDGEFQLGRLEKRLGTSFNPSVVLDDKSFLVRSRTPADHMLVLTNQISTHASVSSLARTAAGSMVLFIKPGSFEKVAFAEGMESAKRSPIIRTMDSAFRESADADGKGDFRFTSESEKRARMELAVAVEDPKALPEGVGEASEHNGMRVALLADSEIFSDQILSKTSAAQHLFIDLVKWTGGEELFSGTTNDEKDKRIEHTKSQDAKWFYGTMVAAPLFVLGLGLISVGRRRLRRSKS